MHGQPNTRGPVRPVRDPPRLDAFGNPLPEEWQRDGYVWPPLKRPQRKRAPELEAFDAIIQQFGLLLKALVSSEAQDKLLGTGPMEQIYSVPRRFDISTLFVVSMAFAFLFALLGYCGFNSLSKLAFCFYISGVGFAQAALFNSRAPRLSSVLAGSFLLLVIIAMYTWGEGWLLFIPASLMGIVLGLPAGYLVGTVCGGVFLVADKVRTRWGW